MSKIRVLPQTVANRIAAGEVVVRPASVVKELLENSIDAGATKLRIDLQKSGKHSIVITDNGCGMDSEDAVLAFQRHATSKIQNDQDIFAISTYGFRGEALPSVASVAQVELCTSRPGENTGFSVTIHGGVLREQKEQAPIGGTRIKVDNLFFNTPARRKFLKNDLTEFNHIMEAVINQSLVSLGTSYEFISDGRKILSLSPCTSLTERVAQIYGRSLNEQLVPLSFQDGSLTIEGLISRPSLTRSNRTMQKLFVNDRAVHSKALSFAIHSAYANVLSPGRHCVSILKISLPSNAIDVNVHPTKDEVKFQNEAWLKDILQKSLKQAIDGMSVQETISEDMVSQSLPQAPQAPSEEIVKPQIQQTARSIEKFYSEPKATQNDYAKMRESSAYYFKNKSVPEFDARMQSPLKAPKEDSSEESSASEVSPPEPLAPIEEQFIEQHERNTKHFLRIADLYVIMQNEQGLLIMDQHAAQERVIYERIFNQIARGQKSAQQLLVPLTIELNPKEMIVMGELKDAFAKIGFELEAFGSDTYALHTIPVFIREKDVLPTVRKILDDILALGYEPKDLLKHFDELMHTMACRAAIKAGDYVTDSQLSQVYEDLLNCEDPNTCPHGRPTTITIPFEELERKFRRLKS